MRAWKGLAVAGAMVVLGAGMVVAAPQSAGQPGLYPRRPPGAPQLDSRFELLRPARSITAVRRLGVTLKELTPAQAQQRKLPSHSGLEVELVQPNGPAEKARIRPGDVIIKVNGEFARSVAQARRLVNETAIGQNTLVTLFRDGKTLDVSVTPEPSSPSLDLWTEDLQRRFDELRKQKSRLFDETPWQYYFWSDPPADQGRKPNYPDLTPGAPYTRPRWPLFQWSPGAERLGVLVQELEPQLAEYFKVKGGALVASVTPESPAQRAGIKAGDVITAVNGKEVRTPADLLGMIRGMKGGEEITLSAVRSGNPMTFKLKLAPGRGTWHV